MSDDEDRAQALTDARDTLVRLKDFRPSERPVIGSHDVLQRWGGASGMPVPPEPRPLRTLSADDVRQMIGRAIDSEHEHIKAILIEVIKELQDDADQTLARAVEDLNKELAHIKTAVSDLRALLHAVRAK